MSMRRCLAFVLALLSGPAAAQSIATFRMDDLDLRDPHLWVNIGVCFDVTSAFNDQVQTEMSSDADMNGSVDASYLVQFLPLDQGAAANFAAIGSATCDTAAGAARTCGPLTMPWVAEDAALASSGTCLGVIAGTTYDPYTPDVTPSTAACWATPPTTGTLTLGGIPITLRNVQVASTFDTAPAQALQNGLIRGFISETDANNTTIPLTYPVIGGRSLSSLLPGGAGNCRTATHSDKDTLDATQGWWFYFNYAGQRVQSNDTFAAGFADGFEN